MKRALSARRLNPEPAEKVFDTGLDVVSNGADFRWRFPVWVVDGPVEVPPPGVDGAGVTAAHRDDDVGGLDDFVGQWLREL